MANIIIPRDKIAETRSAQTEILRKEWGGHGGMNDEQLDKCKYLERKLKEKMGNRAGNFVRTVDVDQVK